MAACGWTISAIVPTLDEEEHLPALLAALRQVPHVECIVVDGGSRDDTVALATASAHRVLVEPDGLAAQLNAGARAARAEVLFFPYADSRLPGGWEREIERVLARPGVVAGAFPLALDSSRLVYRAIAAGSRLRTRLGLGPLGDQALFVTRTAFESTGGFRSGPLLEDLDLVQRLRRQGRLVIAAAPVVSSTRRWEHDGLARTTLRNGAFLLCHLLHIAPGALRRRYRRHRAVR